MSERASALPDQARVVVIGGGIVPGRAFLRRHRSDRRVPDREGAWEVEIAAGCRIYQLEEPPSEGIGSGCGLARADPCPVGIEVRPESGRQEVETDQVREGHREDHRVGEFEDRGERRRAADDRAAAVEEVE